MRFIFKDVYFNQGPRNVSALFGTKYLSPFFLHGRLLTSCFGASRGTLRAYKRDVSGHFQTPLAGTNVDEKNRLDHLTFVWHHQFLAGPGFRPLCKRYEKHLARYLLSFQSGMIDGWVSGDDFMHLFKDSLVGPAIIDSILAPVLLEQHPEFLEGFWTMHDNFWSLASGLPKWIVPRSRAALHQCLAALKAWHLWATMQSDPSAASINLSQDDDFWGSRSVRERQVLLAAVDGPTQDDVASFDLAFLWA